MPKPKDVTRNIKIDVEREMWGRAAARCQFSDCNRLLYKHGVTQEPVNLAERAHIYSFSKRGPRGWGPFKFNRSGLNDVPNLMLVCHDCHKLIDDDKEGERYSADLLKRWKAEHEARVRLTTGIPPTKRTHVVLYGSRVGDENSPLTMGAAFEALFPDWFPADDRPINLSMRSALDDGTAAFWAAEAAHLRKEFDRQVRPRIEDAAPNHFSVFALASQPLLIQLGALLTDKVPAVVYQPVREPTTWRRQPHPADFRFVVNRPADVTGPPAVLFALSDKVHHDRVCAAAGADASIWEVTSNDCHNDCLRSEAQLSEFRRAVRKLFVDLRAAHPAATAIRIFPVMPAACAVELGRVRMPKADLPWIVYDHHNKQSAFTERLTIGASDE
ncbi:MAG TPA: SAVED domain-containing protein [Tepidisphaeraceae bacterium]|nr:SAVED domain-containing protein [Tepidisphaeraceae bacterium]